MSKLQVAVIYGGPSSEHEISLKSAQAVLDAIDNTKYDVLPIRISKENKWSINGQIHELSDALDYLQHNNFFVLNMLHGTFGEDGTIQMYLEKHGIAFSGSGSDACKTTMQKRVASKLFSKAGFLVPNEIVLDHKESFNIDKIINKLSLPVFVKPNAQGSSIGVTKVHTKNKLEDAIKHAFRQDKVVIVQECIEGDEVAAGVIEDEKGKLIALPPTQLIPLTAEFFDYNAKYIKGATDEITPPNLPVGLVSKIQQTAIKAHRLMNCSGYSRTDMIIKEESIYIIEINTLPGMTETSMLPQQVAAAGISFKDMIDMIIQAGLRQHKV